MVAQCLLLLTVSTSATLAPIPRSPVTHVDLQAKANQPLDEIFHSKSFAENHLGSLPQGKQKMGGVEVIIGKKLIQLQSAIIRDKPSKVEGIAINRAFTKLHLLQATSHDVDDGITIGKYVIHYADKTQVEFPIVYGKDVRDWWYGPQAKGVTRAKVAWTGVNKASKSVGKGIRLYLTTWTNPHPAKKVATIDFVSMQTRAGPFCLAMTLEQK